MRSQEARTRAKERNNEAQSVRGRSIIRALEKPAEPDKGGRELLEVVTKTPPKSYRNSEHGEKLVSELW